MPAPGVTVLASGRLAASPVDPNAMYGVTNFTTSNYYATSSPGGDGSGAGSGYFEAILLRAPSALSSATRAIAGRDSNAGNGHGFASTTTGGTLLWGVETTAAGRVSAPTYTGLPSNLNKMILVLGCFKDGSYSRLWVGGTRVGTQTSTTGVSRPGTLATSIGKRIADGFPATGMEIFGFLQGVGEPSDAEVLSWYSACVAAKQLVNLTGSTATTTFNFDVKSAMTVEVVPATISTMTKFGTPTLVKESSPSWV